MVEPPPMRRVMILGSPGSGKSTVARRLGARLDIPVCHLDRLFHQPGWRPPTPSVFLSRVAEVAARPAWIIDGNYPDAAAVRLAVADTIVFLRVPRWLAVVRVARRALLGFGRQRPDAADGCVERIDPSFLAYVWHWRRDVEPHVREMIVGFGGRVIEIRSTRQLDRHLT